jgi:hypothetical protein
MKKTIFTVFIILLFGFTSIQAQESKNSGFFLGAKGGYVSLDNLNPRFYGGIEVDVAFNNNFGIQYSVFAGKKYFHLPLGLATGGVLAYIKLKDTASWSSGIILLGILTAIIPESISYNIALNNNFVLSPYVSPLQFEYWEEQKSESLFAGGAFGVRLHKNISRQRFRLSAYFEYKIHYHKDLNKGFSTGLNFSVNMSSLLKG